LATSVPPVPFDTSVAAIVVKLRHSVIHYGGLGAIRSLGRLGIPVYAVHEGRLAPPAMSRYLSGGLVWDPAGDPELLLDGLTALGERAGGPALLVPTDDAAAIFVAEHAGELAGRFLFPQPPPGLARSLASKRALYQLCNRLGVACPRAVFPSSRVEVEAFLEDAVFPVVAKGAEPWLLPMGAGVRSTTIVRTPERLLDLYRRVEEHEATGLMFQEYIPRDAGQDWFVHGYCDDASACLVSFTGRKLRSYPAHAGPTSLGSWVPNQELKDQAEELFRAISYRGIMDLDYRLDLRDGRYKLLDFNPRLGAQFRLFEDDTGIDVVRAMHLDRTGRAVPAGRPVPGRRFVVENHDPLAGLAYRRSGELTLWRWARSLAGVREAAWFAADDLRPFLAMCVRALRRRVGSPLRRPAGAAAGPGAAPRYLPGRRERRAPAPPSPVASRPVDHT
jgi:predicted ATP-grasp superfamily ATP-dependent carboligase